MKNTFISVILICIVFACIGMLYVNFTIPDVEGFETQYDDPYSITLDNTDVYLINLDRNEDRLESFIEQYSLSDLSMNQFHRIPAVDGKTVELNTDIITEKAFDEITQIEKTGYRTKHYQLTRGAIGCFMSHMKAFEYIANGDKEYGLIFEDDVVIDTNILKRMNMAIEDVPNNWDILVLGCICIVCDKYEKYYDTHRFFLMHCYVVNKKGANRLLSLLKGVRISQQIDSAISDLATEGKLRIYCLRDALSKQSGSFNTTIQTPLKVMPGIDPFVPVS